MSTFQKNVDIKDHNATDVGLTLGGTLVTASADELNRVADTTGRIVNLDATSLAITKALHDNTIITLSHTAAASTVTLPAATGSGLKFTVLVGAVNTNSHIITTSGSDDIEGHIHVLQDSADTTIGFESGATADTVTLNGTTSGGAAVGDKLEFIDYAAARWNVSGSVTATGIEATPFS